MIIKGRLLREGEGEGDRGGSEYYRNILYMYENSIIKPTKNCWGMG
jgi:hypothetical protein